MFKLPLVRATGFITLPTCVLHHSIMYRFFSTLMLVAFMQSLLVKLPRADIQTNKDMADDNFGEKAYLRNGEGIDQGHYLISENRNCRLYLKSYGQLMLLDYSDNENPKVKWRKAGVSSRFESGWKAIFNDGVFSVSRNATTETEELITDVAISVKNSNLSQLHELHLRNDCILTVLRNNKKTVWRSDRMMVDQPLIPSVSLHSPNGGYYAYVFVVRELTCELLIYGGSTSPVRGVLAALNGFSDSCELRLTKNGTLGLFGTGNDHIFHTFDSSTQNAAYMTVSNNGELRLHSRDRRVIKKIVVPASRFMITN